MQLSIKREWKQHAFVVVWWYAIRGSKVADSFEVLNVLHWNLCRETGEHFSLHQIDQSRLDLKVLSEAGWRSNGRARSREVMRKVSLPDWSSLFLLFLMLLRGE